MLCPVTAARWILKGAKAFGTRFDQPALSTGTGSGISADDIGSSLKAAAATAGANPNRFSTHSVRIGGATELLNSGADRLVIKLMGGWLSNAYEDYPMLTARGSGGLSKLMCGKENVRSSGADQ
ncbi:hypothetical protein PR001_g6420 [Phytophthora rubi]|uniref:Tyr recombinase domain-containing protein n=1 Tax=Phytophthora rubi TaxID=129364 RepID=A0A6A3NJZ7_9STRA|nr:hypothetical protein PR001_g6420 [Phytophthora rubi]